MSAGSQLNSTVISRLPQMVEDAEFDRYKLNGQQSPRLRRNMKPDEGFSNLIGRIYDCVLDTSLWPDVLREIAEAVNGVTGDLTVVNPIAGTGHMAAFYNWPDDVRELAHSH